MEVALYVRISTNRQQQRARPQGGGPALATLATALEDPERSGRLQAIQAFAKVVGAGADSTLAAVMANDPDPLVRRQAVPSARPHAL
jgi:hypothetical protein